MTVCDVLFCCAAEDGPRRPVVSAAGCAVRTGAVRESVWPLSDVEETPGRVSVCCYAPTARIVCVNVWEVEFSQTKARRQSYVFNVLHNLLWSATPSLSACKPFEPSLGSISEATGGWLGVMWASVCTLTRAFVRCREEVSLLERNKYKFSPLDLPEELQALFHGTTLPIIRSDLSDVLRHRYNLFLPRHKHSRRSVTFDLRNPCCLFRPKPPH